ncbi:WSC domain-containing protein [Cyathus striatus]|nr:WSC domain-containing protein [Cyathus striatus]
MTPLSCVQFCNAGNYKYAGVEYARVHCDNVIHSPGAPADAGNCNTACTGDPTQACGGSDRIFIYSSSGTVVTPGPSIKQSVGTWVYKGCRVDFSPRSLSNRLAIPSNANSAEYCTAQCKQQGYALAGLEYGSECWCDNYMPYGQLVDDSQCNMVCSGDSTEFCGAGSRLALYQDNSATPPNPSTCIMGRDSFSFGDSGIQFIPRQSSTNTVNGTGPQMFATTLDPSTDGSLQHTVITVSFERQSPRYVAEECT